MRNLKKFLALILAFMMAFSLMVTVNAAVVEDGNVKFGDEEQVTEDFVEDLEVIAGMGLIKGYSAEEFGPKREVTRAEMAAIVYRLVTGDASKDPEYQDKSKLYADYGDFTDVVPTDWYAGYIGYCANASIIVGYGDGTFGPNDKVTGHQALVMLLRAMGYNQPEEFTKADWRQKAASIATQRGLLDKVNDTIYKGNLAANANREVIAEVTFQAATHAQVQYTAAFGYQTTLLNTSTQLTSLGYDNFNLVSSTGIVLGNEATGEKDGITKISFTGTVNPDRTVASYVSSNAQKFKWESSLKDFGHQVDVWYNYAGAEHTTYAVFDRVAKTVLTDAVTQTLDLSKAAADWENGDLAKVVKAQGFRNAGTAFWNYSFGPMVATSAAADGANVVIDDATTLNFTSPVLETNAADVHPLYLLISNDNVNKTLDMVISLDLTVTKITQQNDVGSVPSVGIEADNNSNDYFGDDADNSAKYTSMLNIAQDSLVGDSAKTLGKKVVAIEVTGTDGTNLGPANGNCDPADGFTSDFYYQLSELTNVKKYTVTAVNASTQAVTLSDGTVLERSPLALATDVGFMARARVEGPTVYGEYNFTLDENGKYIFWEPVIGTARFVYGTYLDYQTGLGTSTYTYPLIGVGIDGKSTQDNVISYTAKGAEDPSVDGNVLALDGNAGTNYEVFPVVHRDGQYFGNWKTGKYVGYVIDEEGNLTYLVNGASWNTTGVLQANDDNFGAANIEIGSTDVALGVKKINDANLYLTQNTQFYIVDGAGTDTQKITPIKGLTALMSGLTSLEINTTEEVVTSGSNPYVTCLDGEADEMIYYTQSPFTYAQDYETSAYQVDSIFIPAALLDKTASATSSLVFVGNNARGLINATSTVATQFTMYKDGVEGKYWVAGLIDSADTDAYTINELGHNVFYNLVDSGKKANDGQPVYKIAAVSSTTADKLIGRYYDGTTANDSTLAASASKLYKATTQNSQIALINVTTKDGTADTAFNVGSAKVKNLDTDNWPGIKDSLETLNAASSLEKNDGVTVSCVLASSGSRLVSLIYVDYQP